jgi:MoxR-like ATPase
MVSSLTVPTADPTSAGGPQCFLIKTNRHKQAFDGTICRDPAHHTCGASDSFRAQYCAHGRDDCFDLRIFAANNPSMSRRLTYDGSEMLTTVQPGDVLLFWTYQLHAPRNTTPILVGLYIVDGIDVDEFGPTYTFYPRPDGMLYLDFTLPADGLLRRALGEALWTKQLPASDLSWALRLIHSGVEDWERQQRGRKSYEAELSVLGRLLDEFEAEEATPLYAKFAALANLDLPPAPSPTRPPQSVPAKPAPPLAPSVAAPSSSNPLERLRAAATAARLYYPDSLLTRLHISLASHGFVILSGHSGTGKSRLARLYADAEAAQFGLIRVQPDWVSPVYLWGAYDYLAGAFAPSEAATLVRAAMDEWEVARRANRPARPFVLCLDELNLARVEYYFADVLSAMEQPPDERSITLYSPALTDARGFPARLRLTPNLRFIGTINVDETTHSLSPKVLDRAQVIRLDHVELSALRPLLAETVDPALLERVLGHLEELHRRLADDPVQQFGYRVARQIIEWMAVATQPPYQVPLESALDAQIAQKILPRLRIDPDNEAQMALFEKLLAYYEQFERQTPGYEETLRWLRSRQVQLNQAEAVSGQQ